MHSREFLTAHAGEQCPFLAAQLLLGQEAQVDFVDLIAQYDPLAGTEAANNPFDPYAFFEQANQGAFDRPVLAEQPTDTIDEFAELPPALLYQQYTQPPVAAEVITPNLEPLLPVQEKVLSKAPTADSTEPQYVPVKQSTHPAFTLTEPTPKTVASPHPVVVEVPKPHIRAKSILLPAYTVKAEEPTVRVQKIITEPVSRKPSPKIHTPQKAKIQLKKPSPASLDIIESLPPESSAQTMVLSLDRHPVFHQTETAETKKSLIETEDSGDTPLTHLQEITEKLHAQAQIPLTAEITLPLAKLQQLLAEVQKVEIQTDYSEVSTEIIELFVEVMQKTGVEISAETVKLYLEDHTAEEFYELVSAVLPDYAKLSDFQHYLLRNLNNALQKSSIKHYNLGSFLLSLIHAFAKQPA